jgi:hypothetical protein
MKAVNRSGKGSFLDENEIAPDLKAGEGRKIHL